MVDWLNSTRQTNGSFIYSPLEDAEYDNIDLMTANAYILYCLAFSPLNADNDYTNEVDALKTQVDASLSLNVNGALIADPYVIALFSNIYIQEGNDATPYLDELMRY